MRLNISLFAALVMGFMLASCGSTENTSYDYAMNSGYVGDHADDFSATLTVEELEAGGSMITVELNNTVQGETYPIHAHDAADSATTPNGTPYVESPNASIFAQMATGNGGSVSVSQTTTMSYTELTTTYDGFFVCHDPLQDISTSNTATFLVVGAFAR